jgi:hypothetical protein
VPAARDGGEERRLVDDDEALVPVHHVNPPRHLRLVAQVAVEPHGPLRRVRVVLTHRPAVLVDEATLRQHPRHVDPVRQPVPQPRAHRRPRGRVTGPAVGGAEPRSGQAVACRER